MASDTLLYFPMNLHKQETSTRVYAPMRSTPVVETDGFLITYVLTATVGSLHQGLYVMDGRCWRFILPQPLLSEILISGATVDVYLGLEDPVPVASDAMVFKNGVQVQETSIDGPFLWCVITPPQQPDPPAPPGDLTLIAVRDVSGHRVMKAVAGGTDYASSASTGDAQLVLGISKGAALTGDPVSIQTEGELVEPSWNWDLERPVFNGVDGLLTQDNSASGYSLIVGIPLTPNTILVAVKQPIVTI